MGMRCSRPQGLPVEAERFLREKAAKIDECQHCNRHDGYEKEVVGTCGMFEEIKLYRYTLLDGSTADEFVQQCVLDSGPIEWFGLRWGGIEFRWSEEEMKF